MLATTKIVSAPRTALVFFAAGSALLLGSMGAANATQASEAPAGGLYAQSGDGAEQGDLPAHELAVDDQPQSGSDAAPGDGDAVDPGDEALTAGEQSNVAYYFQGKAILTKVDNEDPSVKIPGVKFQVLAGTCGEYADRNWDDVDQFGDWVSAGGERRVWETDENGVVDSFMLHAGGVNTITGEFCVNQDYDDCYDTLEEAQDQLKRDYCIVETAAADGYVLPEWPTNAVDVLIKSPSSGLATYLTVGNDPIPSTDPDPDPDPDPEPEPEPEPEPTLPVTGELAATGVSRSAAMAAGGLGLLALGIGATAVSRRRD